jgi:hypothetical protein
MKIIRTANYRKKLAQDIGPPPLDQGDYNKNIDERLRGTNEGQFENVQEEELAKEIYHFMLELIDDGKVNSIREAELEAQLNFIDADMDGDYMTNLTSKTIDRAVKQVKIDRKDFPRYIPEEENEEFDRDTYEADTFEPKNHPDGYHVEDTSL